MCSYYSLVPFRLLSGHLLVDQMFSLNFDYFVILVISRFGFEGWIWILIASVPGLCILFTFMLVYSFR